MHASMPRGIKVGEKIEQVGRNGHLPRSAQSATVLHLLLARPPPVEILLRFAIRSLHPMKSEMPPTRKGQGLFAFVLQALDDLGECLPCPRFRVRPIRLGTDLNGVRHNFLRTIAELMSKANFGGCVSVLLIEEHRGVYAVRHGV